jgi:hypothetical protein
MDPILLHFAYKQQKNCMRNGRTLHPLLVVELKKYISLCISIQYCICVVQVSFVGV